MSLRVKLALLFVATCWALCLAALFIANWLVGVG